MFKSSTFTPPTKEIEEGWNVTYDADAYGDGPIQATFPPFLYQGLSMPFLCNPPSKKKPNFVQNQFGTHGLISASRTHLDRLVEMH